MKDVKQVIWRHQAAVAEAARVQADARAEAAAHLSEAQVEIIDGRETTGSPLHDGLVALYGSTLLENPETIEKYERVANELVGKKGEPVVLIQRFLMPGGCGGMGGKGYTTLETAISVGVIASEDLVFDYGHRSCALSVSKLAELDINKGLTHGDHGSSLEVTNLGKLSQWMDLALELDEPLPVSDEDIRGVPGDANLNILTLAIGYTGIETWLSSDDGYVAAGELVQVRELCRVLGISPFVPVGVRQQAAVTNAQSDRLITVPGPGVQ